MFSELMGERRVDGWKLKSKSHGDLWEFSLTLKGAGFGMQLKAEILLNIFKYRALNMTLSI